MNEGEFVSLSNKVGFVLVDDLPPVGGCNILCLSDREVHIIRRFVYPFAEWRSRFVRWLYGSIYQTATEAEYLEYQDEIGQLFNDIGGEDMGCSELATALQAIATALAGQAGGTTVNCGAGCYGAGIPGQAAGYLAPYTNGELIPPPPGEVEYLTPPEGFEDWNAYLAYKCKAAHQVYDVIHGFCRACQGLQGLEVTALLVGPVIAGWMGVFGTIALTPLVWVTLVTTLVAMGVLASMSFFGWGIAADYLAANKMAIVCALYNSGSAVDARASIAGYLDSAIQTIEWGSILTPIAPELGAFMATALASIQENGLFNILFELTADVSYPEEVCDCASGVMGWHFDAGLERWTFSTLVRSPNTSIGQWNAAEVGADTFNGSPGRLWGLLTITDQGVQGGTGQWNLDLSDGSGPVVHTNDVIAADFSASVTGLLAAIGCYLEPGHVYQTHEEANITSWQQIQLTIAPENDGKRVSYIWVNYYPYGYVNGRWETGVDRVYIIPNA